MDIIVMIIVAQTHNGRFVTQIDPSIKETLSSFIHSSRSQEQE